MKQGDVYWYTFHNPDKRRPVLILTHTSAISYLNSVTIAQVTSTIRGVPSEVLLTPGLDGVFEKCVVNAYNLQTIPKSRIGELITQLSPEGCVKYVRRLSSRWDFMLSCKALIYVPLA